MNPLIQLKKATPIFLDGGEAAVRRPEEAVRHATCAMSNVFWARRGLSAAFSIAFALSVTVYTGPAARAFTCQDDIFNSGIAYTGASVVIVASPMRFNGGNLFYFWQKVGTGTWQKQQVASGNDCPSDFGSGWTPVTPTGYRSNAIAWTGSSVVIAAVDQRNGGIYYWWQPSGGTTWNQQTVAAGPPGCCSFGGGTPPFTYLVGYSMPSIAWTGSAVVIAAIDKNGLHYWFQEKGQTTWYHQLVSSQDGNAHPSQPSIAWTGASVVIADTCNAGLCYYWQRVGTAPWHRQVVDSGGGAYPSIAWTGSAVVIAAIQGLPGNVVYWWQAAGAGAAAWHKQQVNTNGPREFSGPSIAWARGNPVIVAADDTTQNASSPQFLNYWWQSPGSNGSWNLQHPDGGNGNYGGSTDPRSIALAGDSVVMTTTDACGDLDYWWQQVGSPTWHKQRVNTNGGWPPGTPGCE